MLFLQVVIRGKDELVAPDGASLASVATSLRIPPPTGGFASLPAAPAKPVSSPFTAVAEVPTTLSRLIYPQGLCCSWLFLEQLHLRKEFSVAFKP